VKEVFRQVDPAVKVEFTCKDGDRKAPNDVLFTVEGPAASILTAERNALNYLQMMSGTATITAKYVDAVKKGNEKTNLLDTRKTIPGFRLAQKYAVWCGGGVNHR
jgi:nicotinate-nucleotide pyrophosphorylase (carboxylating)